MLQNEYLLVLPKFGLDSAENEPSKGSSFSKVEKLGWSQMAAAAAEPVNALLRRNSPVSTTRRYSSNRWIRCIFSPVKSGRIAAVARTQQKLFSHSSAHARDVCERRFAKPNTLPRHLPARQAAWPQFQSIVYSGPSGLASCALAARSLDFYLLRNHFPRVQI